MNKYIISALAAVSLSSAATSSHAVTVKLNFTASHFIDSISSVAPPTDPVTGEIYYEAANFGSPITSLISISLTINGHSYALSEVGFGANGAVGKKNPSGTGVFATPTGTDDFFLGWHIGGAPISFSYTAAYDGVNDYQLAFWQATAFDNFTETVVGTTPLPAALPLFATGLGLMGLLGWRRKRKAQAAVAAA
jgi:hypothetical protein